MCRELHEKRCFAGTHDELAHQGKKRGGLAIECRVCAELKNIGLGGGGEGKFTSYYLSREMFRFGRTCLTTVISISCRSF